jgi:hypothetical protein
MKKTITFIVSAIALILLMDMVFCGLWIVSGQAPPSDGPFFGMITCKGLRLILNK